MEICRLTLNINLPLEVLVSHSPDEARLEFRIRTQNMTALKEKLVQKEILLLTNCSVQTVMI